MAILLLILIVLLTGIICALGGFWLYRERQARGQGVRTTKIARRPAAYDQWDGAVRVFRGNR